MEIQQTTIFLSLFLLLFMNLSNAGEKFLISVIGGEQYLIELESPEKAESDYKSSNPTPTLNKTKTHPGRYY